MQNFIEVSLTAHGNSYLQTSQATFNCTDKSQWWVQMWAWAMKTVKRQMSKTFIGGTVCRSWNHDRRNVRPCHMQQRTVQFSDVARKNGRISYKKTWTIIKTDSTSNSLHY